ncbi:pyridoxamine 5'-phosphate oxidase family protein [Gracilibacillus caseinilyticus]|uniref:Pyridoxamine 5'-phosphate oxidase family protein n=1 Tax=Gracilibacillus caseinilyticus TaxID=2932256 RepID=A0ABY4ETE3_9BACI|nr:pyridoxamine 5'-phosphate oxidase family protein [Gracilibacillus caseinilyticus]UOQ47691.1 pyridoxamine 5'-phosphate oxidase family protein [Gracilibacillus caseinilyticus]
MNKTNPFGETIKTEEELRSLVGFPSDLVNNKVINHLDSNCKDFISKSPFLVMGTMNESGFSDASPRGDEIGFVKVLDEKHLIIPERPGNKRIDSMRNILSHPAISLIFFIPGLGETLRVNGKATLVTDEVLLNEMKCRGKSPILGIGVEVDECFIHCAKALIRSKLWNPETWLDRTTLPSAAKIVSEHAKLPGMTEESISNRLQISYTNKLY